jgi:hypothetical protein
VGRLTLPYLKERPVLVAGYGLVLWSPLESPERQVLRLVDDAVACAEMRAQVREREQRERLLEIIQNREIWTAFQPIVELEASPVAPAARTSSCRSFSSGARPATASPRSSSVRAGARRSSTGGCSASRDGSS